MSTSRLMTATLIAFALLVTWSWVTAENAPTMEDRVSALEAKIAVHGGVLTNQISPALDSLTARLNAHDTAQAAKFGEVDGRLMALEAK